MKKILGSKEFEKFFSFDKLINGNVIINPKNYFLKKIFSNIFKDVIFKDRKFQKLKNLYISRYSDKLGFFIKTKQLEYPTNERKHLLSSLIHMELLLFESILISLLSNKKEI